MPWERPSRLRHIHAIGVDKMGTLADADKRDLLRLENLDTDIFPDADAVAYTQRSASQDKDNSYLPFIGQLRLRRAVAEHVSQASGVDYTAEHNCVISAGGLSGILNVLLATVDEGQEVIVTDPTYRGLTNRIALAGGIPKYVPFIFRPCQEWKLDLEALKAAVTPQTRAMLLMSPSMPSGGYFDREDWRLICQLCVDHDILLILDAAMERLVFDGRTVYHPAGFPGMPERTVTVGSASKELRMIGWRVGWIVGPARLIPDITAVLLANVIVPVGIAQDAVAIALEKSKNSLSDYVGELQARRDLVMSELDGLSFGVPAGGWSMLLRVSDYGLTSNEAVERLLRQGVCVTGMDGWGQEYGAGLVRLVFSNEPPGRLQGLGNKVRRALEA